MGWSPAEVARATAGGRHALPRIDFVAETDACPVCGGDVEVRKSQQRKVVTFAHGAFIAREVSKQCKRDPRCAAMGSEELPRIVKPRQRFGYDLIVHVGLAFYLYSQQREQIRSSLREHRGIELSAGTITNLCGRFLLHLEALHLDRAPALRAEIEREGGYPLHIDATCNPRNGTGGLFVCLDGWRGWVLSAGRIPTENESSLRPLVDKAIKLFGDPVAVVRDMGRAGARAVGPLRGRGVPDLLCHYHFLAAVGKKLLDEAHAVLREQIRQSGIRPEFRALLRQLQQYRGHQAHNGRFGPGHVREDLLALLHWLLKGPGGREPAFPFSLPHYDFVQRCRDVRHKAARWLPHPRSEPERRVLRQLRQLVSRLANDKIGVARRTLDENWWAFCELRDVMRLSTDELRGADLRGVQQSLPAIELLRLQQIEQDLRRYQAELSKRVKPTRRTGADTKEPSANIILGYLERYGHHLFGHPVRRADDGQVLAVVDRTNNCLERFFGHSKQRLRLRVGRKDLGMDLRQQPAQATLVANLRHPEYVRVLCGSLDNMPTAFAALDPRTIEEDCALVRDDRNRVLDRRVRKLLNSDDVTAHPTEEGLDEDARCSQPSREGSRPKLPDATEEELRTRCAGVFAEPLSDPRLPPAGAALTAQWGGVEHSVRILDNGFQYAGQFFESLHVLARAITDGEVQDGLVFFGLSKPIQRRHMPCSGERDPRLPPPGSKLTRLYRGTEHRVLVLETGFEYQGQVYGSLSRIAKTITGTTWNGFLFFGLITRNCRPPRATHAPHHESASAPADDQPDGCYDIDGAQPEVNADSTYPADHPRFPPPGDARAKTDDGRTDGRNDRQHRSATVDPRRDADHPRPARDPRLPPPGGVLTRIHAGVEHKVRITEGGLEYEGQSYRSLSGIARAITGTSWNGYVFFGLTRRGSRSAKARLPAAPVADSLPRETDATAGSTGVGERGVDAVDGLSDHEAVPALELDDGPSTVRHAPATVV